MKYSVKLYGANPLGIPSDWPEVTAVSEVLLPGHDMLMLPEDFDAYIAARQSSYNAWFAAYTFKQNAPALINAEAQRRISALVGIVVSPSDVARFGSDVSLLFGVIVRQLNKLANGVSKLAKKELANEVITTTDADTMLLDADLVPKVQALRNYSNELQVRVASGEVFNVLAQPWPY